MNKLPSSYDTKLCNLTLSFIIVHDTMSYYILTYSAFRFNFSAPSNEFPHYISHTRPEYLPLGRKNEAKRGVHCIVSYSRSLI